MHFDDKPDRPSSRPGTWIAIPLPRGGYAIGLVVRRKESKERRKKILVYIFGPALESLSALPDLKQFKTQQRVAHKFASDFAIQTGRWPIIGKIEPFCSDEWPVPMIRTGPYGIGPEGGRLYEVCLMDDDLEPYNFQGRFYLENPDEYVADGMTGHIAFEQSAELIIKGRHPDDKLVSNEDYVVSDAEWERFNRALRRISRADKAK